MRLSHALVFTLAVLSVCSMAMAIEMGPGAMIYTSKFDYPTMQVTIKSAQIGANWSITPMVTQTVIQDYGTSTGSTAGSPRWHTYDVSPYIKNSNPGGYAKLTLGVYGPNAPASTLTANASMKVLQLVDVQTGVAGGVATTVGSGKAAGAAPNYYSDSAITAWYDKTGVITGQADSYLQHSWIGWKGYDDVVKDRNGDADYSNDAADYIGATETGIGRVCDYKQLGNRLYVSSTYLTQTGHAGKNGVGYYEANPAGGAPTLHLVYSAAPAGAVSMVFGRFGVTTIQGKDTVYVNAAWSGISLRKIQDLDNNPAVLSAGELTTVFEPSMVPGMTWPANDPSLGAGTFDIQPLINEAGTQFLLITAVDQLVVLQLDANGNFAGAGQANPADYVAVVSAPGIGQQFALDAAVPEPATMVLLGIGGLVSVLRRRR